MTTNIANEKNFFLSHLLPLFKSNLLSYSTIPVVALAQRFDVCKSTEELMEEYQDYQLAPASELPSFNPDVTRIDSFWFDMQMTKLPTGKYHFRNLVSVALTALSLPHSNADPERCFSILRKIQTDQRGNLGLQTINSLLSVKFNMDCDCYSYIPEQDVIKKAKSACSDYTKDH